MCQQYDPAIVNNWRPIVNQAEYRQMLRNLSTPDLVDLLKDVERSLAGQHDLYEGERLPLTDNWQAREVLAELGHRQMKFDYGALSK